MEGIIHVGHEFQRNNKIIPFVFHVGIRYLASQRKKIPRQYTYLKGTKNDTHFFTPVSETPPLSLN